MTPRHERVKLTKRQGSCWSNKALHCAIDELPLTTLLSRSLVRPIMRSSTLHRVARAALPPSATVPAASGASASIGVAPPAASCAPAASAAGAPAAAVDEAAADGFAAAADAAPPPSAASGRDSAPSGSGSAPLDVKARHPSRSPCTLDASCCCLPRERAELPSDAGLLGNARARGSCGHVISLGNPHASKPS